MLDSAVLDLPFHPSWPRLTLRNALLAAAWIICLLLARQRFFHGVHEFDVDDRPPSEFWGVGNRGHAQIDFGGQWLMGRMVATGQGMHLYDRNKHWNTLREGYPAERDPRLVRDHGFPPQDRPSEVRSADHTAEDFKTDTQNLMFWMMGNANDSKRWDDAAEGIACALAGGADGNPFAAAVQQSVTRASVNEKLIEELNKTSVGGPLYPPIHGLFYAPIGCFDDPRHAYTAIQLLSVLAGLVSGWAAQWMTRGRLAWPLVSAVIYLFPGCRAGVDLGQNHLISLAIVLIGWACVARSRPILGGALLGLLAFKPVWALAFLLVPVVMFRVRVTVAMGVVGLGLIALSIPVCGIDSWKHWLINGREATETYNTNKNWIELSRDLAGIPKRIFVDFSKPPDERADPFAEQLAWILWGSVLLATVAIYRLKANRGEALGLGAGFLMLGAYLCCYRFMYYDVLLAVAGLCVMLGQTGLIFDTGRWKLQGSPDPFERRVRLAFASVPVLLIGFLIVNENSLIVVRPRATLGMDYFAVPSTTANGKPTTHTPVVRVVSDYSHPVDTVLILLIWCWAGWRLLRHGDYPRKASSAAPMSGARISDSPTSTA